MNTGYKITKRLLLGVLIVVSTSVSAYAQFEDVSSILKAGKADANLLVREYFKPFGHGFGAGMNTGWTNTARTHKKLGFDLTLTAAMSVVPSADYTFNINQIGLTELEYESGPVMSQTLHGDKLEGPTLAAYADYQTPSGGSGRAKLIEFTMPQGTGFRYTPAPMIKGSVGLIKGTDVMVRYIPESRFDDGSFKLWGFGLKHDIKQWLPGGKLLPIDLSVMFGYSNMNLGSSFRVDASNVIQDPDKTENPYANQPEMWNGQGVGLNAEAYTINALVGKTLPMISVYGGLGYEASTFSIKTPGNYPTIVPNKAYENDPNNNKPFTVGYVKEPISVEIEGKNNFRALAGFRLRFAVFHISGSYTLANYSSYNLGFGISFR